ncbi:MAG: LEA type 2 family protein [Nitrospiraceae bacterium]|nr:LEA type 2 family protein [Nitrospiraceae bacterium]
MKLPLINAGTMLRFVVAAIILMLPACAYWKLATTHFEKPTFTYHGIESGEASHGQINVNFLFTAHNPNAAGIRNVTCSFELFVEGKKFMTGKDVPLEVSGRGDTELKVPAAIAYADMLPALGAVIDIILSGRKTIPVTINAVFSGKPAVYTEAGREEQVSFEIPMNETADIPLKLDRR